MSRTINYGISRDSFAPGGVSGTIKVSSNSRLSLIPVLDPSIGGTGLDSSVSTGIPKILAGVWSVGYIRAADFGIPYTGGLYLMVNNDGSLTWAPGGSGPSTETVTYVSGPTYTVQSTDMNLAVDSTLGPVTINLGTIAGTKRLTIFDNAGTAGVNNITIVPGGTDTIMRSTDSLTIMTQNTSITLLSTSSTNWHVVSMN